MFKAELTLAAPGSLADSVYFSIELTENILSLLTDSVSISEIPFPKTEFMPNSFVKYGEYCNKLLDLLYVKPIAEKQLKSKLESEQTPFDIHYSLSTNELILTKKTPNDTSYTLLMATILGQILFTKEIPNDMDVVSIKLSDELKGGMYIVKISSKIGEVQTHKFIIH